MEPKPTIVEVEKQYRKRLITDKLADGRLKISNNQAERW